MKTLTKGLDHLVGVVALLSAIAITAGLIVSIGMEAEKSFKCSNDTYSWQNELCQ